MDLSKLTLSFSVTEEMRGENGPQLASATLTADDSDAIGLSLLCLESVHDQYHKVVLTVAPAPPGNWCPILWIEVHSTDQKELWDPVNNVKQAKFFMADPVSLTTSERLEKMRSYLTKHYPEGQKVWAPRMSLGAHATE